MDQTLTEREKSCNKLATINPATKQTFSTASSFVLPVPSLTNKNLGEEITKMWERERGRNEIGGANERAEGRDWMQVDKNWTWIGQTRQTDDEGGKAGR